MAQNLFLVFCSVAVICVLHHGDAVDTTACQGTDATDVPACTNPFITAHSSSFAAIAGSSTCGLTADCSVVNTAAVCLNGKTLSNTCRQSLREDMNNQMALAQTVCTLDDLYRLCPSTTRVNEGTSGSPERSGSLFFVFLTIICALVFSRTN